MCNNFLDPQNTATHVSSAEKMMVTLTWNAPKIPLKEAAIT